MSRFAVLALGLLLASACDREKRDFDAPPSPPAVQVAQSNVLVAGPRVDTTGGPLMDSTNATNPYAENRWAISEGQTSYERMNCGGCHATHGGGGIGPPLRDSVWIYGSEPEAIFQTIAQGRPNGMPSFGVRLAPAEIWKLASYVRAMAQLTPRDTWIARPDNLSRQTPQNRNRAEP